MMRVSDPIIFGHAVRAYFADVFERARRRAAVGRASTPTTAWAPCSRRSRRCPTSSATRSRAAIEAAYERGPALAMVDSDRGITNLHVPSDVIIDASMPAAIRSSGQMWNADGRACRTPSS